MIKKIRFIIVMLLIVVLIQPFMNKTLAYTINDYVKNTVYIDGIKYEVIDTGEEVIIKNTENFEVHLYNDGKAYIERYTSSGKIRNDFIVNNLTEDDVDIEYIDDEGELQKITKVDIDEYEGQMAGTAVIIGIGSVSILQIFAVVFVALLATVAIVYIAKVAYRALDYALQKMKINTSRYYSAYIISGSVFVSVNPIDRATAISRVRSGLNIYTFYGSEAKSVVTATGLGVTGPEIDKRTTTSGTVKRGVYYYHYHTKNRNGAHAFYGKAYIY